MPPEANDTAAPAPGSPEIAPVPASPTKRRGGDKGGAKRPKTRGVALERRLDQVEHWVLHGKGQAYIVQHAEQLWHIAPRTVDDYLAAVNARLEEAAAPERAAARKRAIRRALRIAERAMSGKKPNLFAALQAEQHLTHLEGTKYQSGDDLPKDEGTEVVFDIDLPDDDADELPVLRAVGSTT